MTRILFIITLVIVFIGCKEISTRVNYTQKYFELDSNYTDYLVSFYNDSLFTAGISCGYKNMRGEIIIPIGKYSNCFTDTFKNFAFVYDDYLTNAKIVAIDRNENILFEAYMYDNGPDYLSDGLFRIVRNGKIGYADKMGIITITPQYDCAEPFVNGLARVSYICQKSDGEIGSEHSSYESHSWFFIDKFGNRKK